MLDLERFKDMVIYAKVAHLGSFTAAAEQLGIAKGTVSKAITRLESDLNLRLLQRTTRTISMTLEGRAYFDYCSEIIRQAEAAEHHLGTFRDNPSGVIRVTAPVTFGSVQVAPLLPPLLKRFPDLQIELLLEDKRVDLMAENIDIALRCGNLESSTLIARRLRGLPLVMVATPGYLTSSKPPKQPEELREHQCLLHGFHAVERYWQVQEPDGSTVRIPVRGQLRVNNNQALKHALLADLGIAYLPRYQVEKELESGAVIPILTDFMPAETPVHAVYRHRAHLSAAMRATLEYFQQVL
ncbi:MAG TPA: LysR family transcriptional regulator [Pseudidiomarina sp.]|nr:LysR family transcriptional regulator [Pseudidiomarina sp.]